MQPQKQSDKQKSEAKNKVKKSTPLKKTRGVTVLSAEKKAVVMLLRGENEGLRKQLKRQKNGTGGLWHSKSDIDIPVDNLKIHLLHPKRSLRKEEIEPLANSILLHGLCTPILVTPSQDNPERYYILDGARRWEAVKQLGWKKVRCNVTKLSNDLQVLGLMLSMEGNRRGFDSIEKGDAFLKLREDINITEQELADLLQVDPKEIFRCEIPIRKLCQEVIDAYKKSTDRKTLKFNYLKLLEDLWIYPEQQWLLYQEALEQNWSLDQMRAAVKRSLKERGTEPEMRRNQRPLSSIQTELFNVYIKPKRTYGIQPADVFICAGAVVEDIFCQLQVRGEKVANWYEKMAEHARKQWREERERIRDNADYEDYEEDPEER